MSMSYNVSSKSVYNHYLTTYAPKADTKYDMHGKRELRNIYNSIVKLNKDSPCISWIPARNPVNLLLA